MTKVPGQRVEDIWHTLPFPSKQYLVQQIARMMARLYQHKSRGIGNLYLSNQGQELDRIVSMPFFWDQRLRYHIHRGPFHDSREWLLARLAMAEIEAQATLAKFSNGDSGPGESEDDIETPRRNLAIISRLSAQIDAIFPSDSGEVAEETMLFHEDLNDQNILVSPSESEEPGVGIVDWECVSFLPLWYACNYPAFLQSRERHKKPAEHEFARADQGKGYEEVDESYWEQLREYECTHLRAYFMAEMGKLEPGWLAHFDAGRGRRDLESAVEECANVFGMRKIEWWLDCMEDPERESKSCLVDMRYGGFTIPR